MPKRIRSDHQRDSHPPEQKGGDDMQSVGDNVEQWLKAERVPEFPTEAPTNLAVIYVEDYVPEVEGNVLAKVKGRDVVLVARGSELASYVKTHFAASGGSVSVVDYLDSLARERYLAWLADLAGLYPHTKVLWGVLGFDPVEGRDPWSTLVETELVKVMEIAPHVFRKELVENQVEADGRPAEQWFQIPVDDVPRWVIGEFDGSAFEVPAEHGTLRVELRGVDPGRLMALFYVYRLDTGENVACVYRIVDGQPSHTADADVWDALEPFPEGAEFMLIDATSRKPVAPRATEPRNGDSAVPRDVDEEGEIDEPEDNG